MNLHFQYTYRVHITYIIAKRNIDTRTGETIFKTSQDYQTGNNNMYDNHIYKTTTSYKNLRNRKTINKKTNYNGNETDKENVAVDLFYIYIYISTMCTNNNRNLVSLWNFLNSLVQNNYIGSFIKQSDNYKV